jgi:P27 family predicted phage terminase small subunit
MTTTEPRPPTHLSDRTKKLWRTIAAKFDLAPEHLEMLRLGLEALDRCDQARRQLAKDGLVVVGARGAPQRHPLVDVEIQSRTAALRIFRELGLTAYLDDGPPDRDGRGKFR